MKKMTKLLAFLLALLLLTGCTPAGAGQPTEPTTEPTETTTAEDVLAQRRELVAAVMRESLTVLWRLDEDLVYSKAGPSKGIDQDKQSDVITLVGGRVYQGLPYTHGASAAGSFLDFAKSQDSKGVFTLTGLNGTILSGNPREEVPNIARIGNDCSSTLYWAWANVSSSVTFSPTKQMTVSNGYVKVGDYNAPEDVYTSTRETAKENGLTKMCNAYAQLQLGDAVTMYVKGSGGHTMMVTEVHVEMVSGIIDPKNSYVLVMDQGMTPYKHNEHYYNEQIGEEVYLWGRVDEKFTFQQLYSQGYLPMTCKELIDPAPLEKLTLTDTVATATKDNMFQGVLKTNYGISSVTITITNGQGQQAQQLIAYSLHSEMGEFRLERIPNEMSAGAVKGSIDLSALAAGTYRCTYVCQMSTGEQLTARDFTFTI